jgi:hypothetical protein
MTQLPPTAHEFSSAKPAALGRRPSLVKIGGSLGIASVFIVIAIFVVALFNIGAVFILVPLALALSSIGLIISLIGGVARKHEGNEEVQPIAALFACSAGLIFALLEWMVRAH